MHEEEVLGKAYDSRLMKRLLPALLIASSALSLPVLSHGQTLRKVEGEVLAFFETTDAFGTPPLQQWCLRVTSKGSVSYGFTSGLDGEEPMETDFRTLQLSEPQTEQLINVLHHKRSARLGGDYSPCTGGCSYYDTYPYAGVTFANPAGERSVHLPEMRGVLNGSRKWLYPAALEQIIEQTEAIRGLAQKAEPDDSRQSSCYKQLNPRREFFDVSPHADRLLSANGIDIEYLDWGGDGPWLVLLSDLGQSPHVFDDLAPRLSARFHVLGIARRGHARTSAPESGYDLRTLVEDLHGVFDALHIPAAILVGYSFAGIEITSFATRYPDRTLGLVYLDAAYDYSELPQIEAADPYPVPPPATNDLRSFDSHATWFINAFSLWRSSLANDSHAMRLQPDGTMRRDVPPPAIREALRATMVSFKPDYAQVKAPLLAFYAGGYHPRNTAPDVIAAKQSYWKTVYLPYQRRQIRSLKASANKPRVVLMDTSPHLCFVGVNDEDLLVSEILRFASGKKLLSRGLK